MGGKLFSMGISALYTPRMVPPIYRHVYSHVSARLGSLFPRVTNYIEGPSKPSFGDMDVAVNLEGSVFTQEQKEDWARTDIWAAVEKALGPVRTHHNCRRLVNVKSLAIPWPKDISPADMTSQLALEAELLAEDKLKAAAKHAELSKQGRASGGGAIQENMVPQDSPPLDRDTRFVHVDIRLCDNTRDLEWHMFKNCHGYIWNFLGSSMRPFGLFIDNNGLQLSVHDHAKVGPKTARSFLSNDPTAILDFLELSHANGEWTRPFKSHLELLQYVSTWRWYSLQPFRTNRSRINPRLLDKWRDQPELASFYCKPPPAYGERVSLGDVRRAAFSAFPGSEQAYVDEIARWRLDAEVQRWPKSVKDLIDSDACIPAKINHALPGSATNKTYIENAWRKVLRAALKKLILRQEEDDYKFESVEIPDFDPTKDSVEKVAAWIRDNWEAVGHEAWDRVAKAMVRIETSGAEVSVNSPMEAAEQVWGEEWKSRRENNPEETGERIQENTWVKTPEKRRERSERPVLVRRWPPARTPEERERSEHPLFVRRWPPVRTPEERERSGDSVLVRRWPPVGMREEASEDAQKLPTRLRQPMSDHASIFRRLPRDKTVEEVLEETKTRPPTWRRHIPWSTRTLSLGRAKEAGDEAAAQGDNAQPAATPQDIHINTNPEGTGAEKHSPST